MLEGWDNNPNNSFDYGRIINNLTSSGLCPQLSSGEFSGEVTRSRASLKLEQLRELGEGLVRDTHT